MQPAQQRELALLPLKSKRPRPPQSLRPRAEARGAARFVALSRSGRTAQAERAQRGPRRLPASAGGSGQYFELRGIGCPALVSGCAGREASSTTSFPLFQPHCFLPQGSKV